jgi:hypothetical protein
VKDSAGKEGHIREAPFARVRLQPQQIVFKPLSNRPFLHRETEPRINGRILAVAAYFGERPGALDALAKQSLGNRVERC